MAPVELSISAVMPGRLGGGFVCACIYVSWGVPVPRPSLGNRGFGVVEERTGNGKGNCGLITSCEL